MKKIILTTVIILSAITAALAQTSTNVTVNLKLNAVQSIVANAASVDLEYKTISDYNVGVQSDQANHLTVYSTGGFIVKVSSSVAQLSGSKGSDKIESSGITLTASKGTATVNPTFTPVNLGIEKTPLITSSLGGADLKFNVNYKAAGNNAYINKFFKGTDATAATVYSTVVTYSIEAN